MAEDGRGRRGVLCSELIAPEQPVHGVGHSMGRGCPRPRRVGDRSEAPLVVALRAHHRRTRTDARHGWGQPLAEGRSAAGRRSRHTRPPTRTTPPSRPLNELAPDALWATCSAASPSSPTAQSPSVARLRPKQRCFAPRRRAVRGRGGHPHPATEVVSGREEAFGPGSYAPLLVAELANARLLERGDLGHFGPLEDRGGWRSTSSTGSTRTPEQPSFYGSTTAKSGWGRGEADDRRQHAGVTVEVGAVRHGRPSGAP